MVVLDFVTVCSYCCFAAQVYCMCKALIRMKLRCLKIIFGYLNQDRIPIVLLCFECVFFSKFHVVCFSICIFCGERNESFTEEGLDLHYWKHCPMLKRCTNCKQVSQHFCTCIYCIPGYFCPSSLSNGFSLS